MFTAESSIIINRPIETVFAFIADNENDPKWCIPVVTTTCIVGDAPGANAQYSFASKMGFITLRGQFTILEFEPPHRLTWEGESSINRFSGTYTLEETEDGTLLTEKTSFELKWFLRPFESRSKPQFDTIYETQLKRLKKLLES